MEEFQEKYGKNVNSIFFNDSSDPTQSFNVQMGKLAFGLLSGKYSTQESEECQESMVKATVKISSLSFVTVIFLV